MQTKIIFIILFMLVLSTTISAQQPIWYTKIKSIELLKATRADIIELFGQPLESQNPHWKSYELPEGEMDVEYSSGLCGDKNKNGWNVPEFTVTRVFFDPAKRIKPKILALDLTKFRKYAVSDVPNSFNFESDVLGINFGVNRKGYLQSFEFRPSEKYNNWYCEPER